MNKFFTPVIRCVVTACISLASLGLTQAAIAQVQFRSPPDSAPGNRETGASRGGDMCSEASDGVGMSLLSPDTLVGSTVQSSPTFLAYVPQNNAVRTELFVINETTGDEVFRSDVELPNNEVDHRYTHGSAVIGISLPNDGSVRLQEGESYLWALTLVCNDSDRVEDITVMGIVQRVGQDYLNALEPSVQEELAALPFASESKQVEIYEEAGLWQDMAARLASLAYSQPESYLDEWNRLLMAQGLGAIVNTPLFLNTLESTPEEL